MGFDNAYEAITEENDHSRWAFGTGFADPLAGVDTSIPAGVDTRALADQALGLGDDALVMAQRLTEWVTNAPELEEEVALANIGLDLLGQARMLLARAAQLAPMPSRTDGQWPVEDELAYLRDSGDFRNVRLVEQPRGDFAQEIARLLVFSTWRLSVLQGMGSSPDPVLAAIAAKGVKELTYHRQYAADWAVRLGDGTDYSHERMVAGLRAVWPYVEELFDGAERAEFDDVIGQVCTAARVELPDVSSDEGGGRAGRHTEHLAELLAEMQGYAREHEDATW